MTDYGFKAKENRASIWIDDETAERLDRVADSRAEVLYQALGEWLDRRDTVTSSNYRVQCLECSMFVTSMARPCWNCGNETYRRVTIDYE